MIDKIFHVTTPNGYANEYFDRRESAINFIIDEFAVALVYRVANEDDMLRKYLQTHSETPDKYPFKYIIEEIKINHEYD